MRGAHVPLCYYPHEYDGFELGSLFSHSLKQKCELLFLENFKQMNFQGYFPTEAPAKPVPTEHAHFHVALCLEPYTGRGPAAVVAPLPPIDGSKHTF